LKFNKNEFIAKCGRNPLKYVTILSSFDGKSLISGNSSPQPSKLKTMPEQTFPAIRKRIQLVIENCRELFAKDKFCVKSTPIELIGFKWHLQAKMMEKGFLGLYLYTEPPDGFHGSYRIEVDWLVIQFNGIDTV
jgi:hypothetical protein